MWIGSCDALAWTRIVPTIPVEQKAMQQAVRFRLSPLLQSIQFRLISFIGLRTGVW